MSDPTNRLSTALRDRYVIERELGQGGMATVYLAHDVRHDRKVALKVLRPELAAVIGAERFLVEIKTTANLQHPHILPLHDSGEADGTVFYVMPFIEGESLRDRLNRERQLPVDDAIRIAREVADALDYAHRHGVIHRDIKPENILLHDDRALVADFGIALAVSKSDGGTRMTETGMSLGTPHYMSPEQAMGEREITAKSDVYALGCVLYEMLSGEPPFAGPTAQAIIARVLTEEPRSLTIQRRTIPPHVEAAVQKALAKLPADRFSTAAQFSDALANPAFAATVGTAGAVATAAPSAGPPVRRSATTIALAVTTILALALAAWGWLRARAAEHPPAAWQYVTLGDSIALSLNGPDIALSPNGATLVVRSNSQTQRLWLKHRGALDPMPIAGTERADNPVFSPDGEWVAFIADGKLKKVRAVGGPTVTLADTALAGFGGVAWLDDGTLIYGIPRQNQLRRVNGGGGPSTVALQDSTLSGGGMGLPVALPGARGVLFQYCGPSCVTTDIHVLDLRTGKQKLLLNGVVQAWYLSNGYLLYARRDGVVLAAPFDLDRLEITGEALPVLEGVAVNFTSGFADLTASRSGSLVYVQAVGTSADNVVVRVGRDGAVAPTDTSWYGPFESIDLSPDGRHIATGVTDGANLNVWVKTLGHGPFVRLSFGNRDRRPAWSPDGRMVAFIRDSTGGNVRGGSVNAVYARPADASGPEQLLGRIDRQVQEVAWSPNGRWLLLRTDNGAAGAGDIVGLHTTGDTTPVSLVATPFTELNPAVSPDGRWLAYVSDESGTNEVYVRPFPNTDGGVQQVSIGGGSSPVWSPNEHELFYVDAGGHLVAAQVRQAPLFAVERRITLFDATGYVLSAFHQSFRVAPDGTFLFLRGREAGGDRTPRLVWVEHWFSDLAGRLKQ
jgi:Tol biopolymer transport system component/tRNA A-37 threonylcarbamoyl transferase component Bud32